MRKCLPCGMVHDSQQRLILLVLVVAYLVLLFPLSTSSFDFIIRASALSYSKESDSNIYNPLHQATIDNSLQRLIIENDGSARIKEHMIFGAYVPDGIYLEKRHGHDLAQAISNFLKRGFNDYYFVMSDFRNSREVNATEALLTAADKTELKINIILLPPTEGGPHGNYDWDGWINYFNTLKTKHPSFEGFVIDDLNWADLITGVKFVRNIDFMIYTKLSKALEHKRADIEFYPLVYFEGARTNEVVSHYAKFSHSIILVSANYYNVSKLEKDLLEFKDIFKGKSIYYFIYPTDTLYYQNQGYDPPSDRLLMATLSIASRVADGIIFWHNIDSHVVRDFLQNRQNPEYVLAIRVMEKLQIADEEKSTIY